VRFPDCLRIASQIDDFSLINFHPLDLTSEESIGSLLSHIDSSMQYGEDEEPKEPKDMDMGDFEQD
jgi:hypothetical protein